MIVIDTTVYKISNGDKVLKGSHYMTVNGRRLVNTYKLVKGNHIESRMSYVQAEDSLVEIGIEPVPKYIIDWINR